MAATNTISVQGDAEIKAAFAALPASSQRRVLRPVVSKATTPIARRVKQLAPKESGLLRKSIGRGKLKTYPTTGTILQLAGPRKGFKVVVSRKWGRGRSDVYADPVKYSHLVEGGTGQHAQLFIYRTGREVKQHTIVHPGTDADRFTARAYEQLGASTLSTAIRQIRDGVIKESARLLAKSTARAKR